MTRSRTVLHAGCGGDCLPPHLAADREVRLDIDPRHEPDIVASITDMGHIGPFDALYCSHCLEHLWPGEVPVALSEFHRVLRDGGVAVVIVPDLEDVRPTEEVVYESPCGPVCGLDMIYGKPELIAANPYMAHHCGFVAETLTRVLTAAGFRAVNVMRSGGANLIGVAIK